MRAPCLEQRPRHDKAERAGEHRHREHRGHHLGAERLRRAHRDDADQRRVDQRAEEGRQRERDHHRRDGKVEREREHGQRQRDERCRAEAKRVVAADDLHCRDAAEHGAEAEGREERPRHLRTVELLVGEHGEPRAQHLSEPVRDERREPENAQEPVAQEETDSCEDALAVVRLRQRWPGGDEEREQDERAEEGRGVDVEHDRRAEGGDQEPRRCRPQQRRGAIRALDHGVRLRHDVLVVAHQLGQDEPLRREVRRDEDADQRDEHEEQREREHAELVQQRDRREQRHARQVGHDHRAPRAEAGDHGAGRDPEDRDRHELGRKDDAHPRRRARGREHEPRQREERHLRAERRDDLRRDQRDERTLAERARGRGQISHVPSCCTTSPSSSIRVPGIRRSLTMSQWMRDSFVPPRSGIPFPSARCTVPSIFSSNRMFRM